MGQYNTEERELDLKDLFWKLLKSWRLLVVWALVFAVLLGAFGYLRSGGTQSQQAVGNREELLAGLTDDEIRQLNQAENLRRQLDSLLVSIDEDPLMEMNPYEITQTTMQFYISADSIVNEEGNVVRSFGSDLQAAYQARLADNDVREALAELTGNLTAEQISSYVVATLSGTSSLQVSIVSDDSATCEAMADYVEQMFAEYSEQLQTQIGAHEITLIAENTRQGYSASIDTLRGARIDSLSDLQSSLEEMVDGLSEAQQAVYEFDVAAEEAAEDTAAGTVAPVGRSINVKYIVLGFVLGGFLACVWVALRYVLDGKMKTADELGTVLPNGFLGTVYQQEGRKKRFLGGIDAWLERLQYRGLSGQTEEEQLGLLASNLELLCAKDSLDSLYVTGSAMSGEDSRLLDQLAQLLAEKKIRLAYGASAAKDAKSLEKMAKCGRVLLWEQANRSRYEEFVALAALCRAQGVTVLGAVMEV